MPKIEGLISLKNEAEHRFSEEYEKLKTSKSHGQVGSLLDAAFALVIIGIVIAVSFVILQGFNNSITNGSAGQTAINDTVRELANITDYFPVVVGLAVLGMVVFALLPFLGGVMGGGRKGQ